ncbi:tryptophan--tRNA ligase, chloroplastic/mitochondrial-like [Durio zibethinus]|uniref:tryptophan--tRNA ligase n=1 Tax=Durio zibethinus TaxID=66656 RepID=A0A6P5ZI41_DURZI|nr:tryptophan--tRNA ligase, chloroplastic/mitochondrial-like [Durio zibethinus]
MNVYCNRTPPGGNFPSGNSAKSQIKVNKGQTLEKETERFVRGQFVRFVSASHSSCGGLRSKYLKRPGFIRVDCSINGDNGDGFRCSCSDSLSQPAAQVTSSSVRKRVVSGVQPTGAIHLGNYVGAIKNWIALQNSYDTLFFIVDLHAITLPYDTQQFSKATRNTAAIYLACGVDTSKASVFVQSHVRAHVELMWLLSSATPIGWLNRMIQFKEKSHKAGDENVGVALLTYPVLMASDILLYQSDFVPVGEDQKQHLELTRELAERVNYLYGGRKWKKLGERGGAIFKIPEPLIPPAGARVMSLSDGLSKMSKSATSDQSRINLLDPKDEVAQECQDMNWGTFKTLLTDALVDPIQVRHEEIISDPAYLDGVLAEGAMKAAAIADATLNNVYQAMGFLRR